MVGGAGDGRKDGLGRFALCLDGRLCERARVAVTYAQLFLTILPVFLLIALGVLARRQEWISQAGEDSMFNLVFRLFFPALILESVLTNPAVREPANLFLPPLAGFLITAGGMGIGWLVGRAFGLRVGSGLRTFALAVGMSNYGYLPLPIMESLFGAESRGVLLVHNLGVETAIWTVGLLVVSGASLRAGWRKLLNAPLVTLVVAVALNLSGVGELIPPVIWKIIHPLAACAVPLGLLMTGVSIQPHLSAPGRLLEPRISATAVFIRLALLPVVILLIARFGPWTEELRRVLVVQAAMPSAVLPVILARVYGGQPLIAVQIVLATTAMGLFSIPFWLKWGLAFANP